MGLLSRFKRDPPPTTTDYVEDEKRVSAEADVEKVAAGVELDAHREAHQHDPVAEARVVRKLDCRVPVLLGALYLLSFLDRSNIGYAMMTLLI